jgi:hypothetical protein
MYGEYWRLKGLHKLNLIYKESNSKLEPFLKLYRHLIKEKGMTVEKVVNTADIATNKLPYMESLYGLAKDESEKMQRTIQRLANDADALKYEISILDKIAFSSEEECKRKEQQIQELVTQKDR